MNEEHYQNREIESMFSAHNREEVFRHEAQMNELREIKEQTIRTNGRVTKLEWWRQWVTGGMAVIVMIIIPLFSWMLYKVSSIDSTVQLSVEKALLPYSK